VKIFLNIRRTLNNSRIAREFLLIIKIILNWEWDIKIQKILTTKCISLFFHSGNDCIFYLRRWDIIFTIIIIFIIMEVEAIPKPAFASCDETSLKLKCEYEVSEGQLLFLQYKEPHEDWSKAREIAMDTEATIKIGDVVDLKPGMSEN
jgi:uncharacterized membrane protein